MLTSRTEAILLRGFDILFDLYWVDTSMCADYVSSVLLSWSSDGMFKLS